MFMSEAEDGFIDVLPVSDLPPGSQHVHQVGMTRILVCHTEPGQYFAVVDVCPHARQSLAGGRLNDNCITCPKHGARFDLQSGSPLNGVSKTGLKTLSVRARDGRIQVCVARD